MRVADLEREQLSAYDEFAATRGGVARGPFTVWLRSPQLAVAASRFGNQLRLEGRLADRLLELTILTVARHWRAGYPWAAHARLAAEAGLSPEIVEAVRQGRFPEFAAEDERIVYDVVSEALATGTHCQASYDRGVAVLGIDGLAEVITAVGFYSTASLVANVFEVSIPDELDPWQA